LLNDYEKWFAGYTADVRSRISGANFNELSAVLDEVDLKIEHTYLVKDRTKEIAQWLKLSERDIEIAAIIGLFHDLGRFRQALQFGTMDDRVTGSHGEMSADIFLQDVPKDGLSAEEIQIIASALRYHNVFSLPSELTGRSLMFAQIARDGDKLDIYRFYTDGKDKRGFRHIMSEEEGDYSPDMVEGVLSGKNMRISGIHNKNDRILMQISMVYNMNFGYTFRYMLEKDYLAFLTENRDEILCKAYDYATKWMRERIDKR